MLTRFKPRGFRSAALLLFSLIAFGTCASLYAAEDGSDTNPESVVQSVEYLYWLLLVAGSASALGFARVFYLGMKEADEGTPRMIEIAGHVTEGAIAYLRQQYKIVAIYFVVVFFLLIWAMMSGVQETWVPFAFLTGGFWSGLAGYIGMRTATAASSRTAAGAQKSLNSGLQVAFRSGAVMGLCVVGLGTLDMAFWYMLLRFILGLELDVITVTMLCSLMGASSQALFARVGGGIFTKAADVGADLVGKVEQGIPEDDPRNPATIADNVGDNVGDVAGMGADLYESYCGSILASAALGVAAITPGLLEAMVPDTETTLIGWKARALFLPMVIAAVGIGMSIACIYLVKAGEDASQKALLKVLGRGIDASMIGVGLLGFLITYLILGSAFFGISLCIVVGLVAGWVIGKWTEYSTSDEFAPTQKLAEQTRTGAATVIIGGVADGMKSVWVPIMVVSAGMLLAFGFATGFRFEDLTYFTLGLYGVGIAAVGMLSTLGITLATDAYGPIADNAGGNAEMAGLDKVVRERTDALDSLGNTTAATGKGFAIGSAALTALALLASFAEQVKNGIEKWGESVVVAEEGKFYKVSEKFMIYRTTEKNGSSDVTKTYTYLLSNDALRRSDASFGQAWNELKEFPAEVGSKFVKIDNETMIASINIGDDRYDPVPNARRVTLPELVQFYNATVLNPRVLIGLFIGCMAVFVFCALTMKAVGRAAFGMVEEVRRQFKENPGIMDGTSKPDYARPVAISTQSAQKEMILPSLMGILTPVITGLILGVPGVLGLLAGTLTCGFCVAIFMANSGGSWDNAKKYIEAGHFGGKGSDAHKAAVVGDTVGDPFKDTSGPSLNILIKLMSIVSVVAAGLIVRFSLDAMGVF
jgi:K(+)-stimulated pyrophosphate-energized sodium pump